MTTLEVAPDLEDLAAYVDGRLSGDRKARVEEHLLHDEDYYEIFLETVRFQEEQARQESPEEGKIVRWPGKQVIGPLAAAAILVVSLMTYRFVEAPQPGDLVADLDPATIVAMKGWEAPGWRTMRGADEVTEDQAVAYRLGVRSIGLKVALAARDLKNASEFLSDVNSRINAAPILYNSAIAEYDSLLEDLQIAAKNPETADLDALLAAAKHAEDRLLFPRKEFPELSRFLNMGLWAELGRLAALSHNDAVLRASVRRAKKWKNTSISQQVDTLATLRRQERLSQADFERAHTAFSEITRAIADDRIE